ncbi:MAG: hypothetical protein HYV41_04960 [Candidatus Magasanikbacteria bacterium]|nr:hypothetical protein [Candidatus Magasanikbacteria bacterium]
MKHHLHNFFIPHAGNNYHPHILHTKRAFLYGGLFIAMKVIVISFTALLPLQVFVMPDVLKIEGENIIAFTNQLREDQGLAPLEGEVKLFTSSDLKAQDMATKEYFDHRSPEGKGLADFLTEAGYDYHVAGENLAIGFFDAKKLVDAWKNSPTHYANLVDPEFFEIGVGVEVGNYNGSPTVYVAQHFGSPALYVASEKIEDIDTQKLPQDEIKISAQQNSNLPPEIEQSPTFWYDKQVSRVFWEEKNGKTKIIPKAYIIGDVDSAVVRLNQYSVELYPSDEEFIYHGQITIFKKPEDIFTTIIEPSISIKFNNNAVIQDTIDWDTLLIAGPTPFEKYTKAKGVLGSITSIFDVSRNIYLGFIIFFSITLLLKIFIEFKKQHPHVIFQTILLIGLLVVLFEV